MLVEITGWLGAALVLGAYLLLSCKKISSESYGYHGMNIAGSMLLGAYAVCKDADASVVVNLVWMLIGVGAVVMMLKQKKNP